MDKTPADDLAAQGGARALQGSAVEGFAVETHDGLIFTVKGLVHPPDRRIAYLRYAPDPRGDRERDGRRYRKLHGFAEQLEALEGHGGVLEVHGGVLERQGEAYLVFDPVAGAVLQGVPVEAAARVFDPRRRLREVAARGPADALEEAALALAQLLRETAAVPGAALGVTGSLLVGLQTPDSDVDLVVYGSESCRAVHAALGALLDDTSSPLRRPAGEDLAAIHAAHRRETPLGAEDFARLQKAKVNEGLFSGRAFFVRFVKAPGEVTERYGDFRYEPLGPATVEARVAGAAEAVFTPCRYLVEAATVLETATAGPAEAEVEAATGLEPAIARPAGADAAPVALREIVSFRGRFADQAREGERVRARGTLERVLPRSGAPFARLVVGAPGDYLLSLPG
ncbi:MAG: nucleotidyltransferase domain-containing protein [Thermoleophilia bacterium]|jgi:predicted nucleotidyltransferase|nr:nucleotidyltransferase domain-containing protein [Thermoleophilia bacterium]